MLGPLYKLFGLEVIKENISVKLFWIWAKVFLNSGSVQYQLF